MPCRTAQTPKGARCGVARAVRSACLPKLQQVQDHSRRSLPLTDASAPPRSGGPLASAPAPPAPALAPVRVSVCTCPAYCRRSPSRAGSAWPWPLRSLGGSGGAVQAPVSDHARVSRGPYAPRTTQCGCASVWVRPGLPCVATNQRDSGARDGTHHRAVGVE